ncbi:hypothetical protein TIFTF001_016620 [Ficus carica]|uniref:Uncharacterized protein n=1 Tax=Ficus carica TaxID=3494 RepID=A0AA88AJV8_FICCA|nr:hypothetical protein TIFTF001_016620 [Ficus carica]
MISNQGSPTPTNADVAVTVASDLHRRLLLIFANGDQIRISQGASDFLWLFRDQNRVAGGRWSTHQRHRATATRS